uniref:Small conductance calcium-activated potassium channel-like protein n=1 Tax=Adineta vaga TaxID=104782 RepID=B3G4J5_ADIVA|nr:small conductance calcium-activated potassium channel-like protein [Adineta vaga]
MDFDKNSNEPLIPNLIIKTNHITSNDETSLTSTIISMNSNVRRSLTKEEKTTYPKKSKKLTNSESNHILADVSHRLTKRKQLQERCSLVNDIMCFIALLGIVLMIWENELTFVSSDHLETNMTWSIKLIITLSTIVLIALIIYYHYLDMVLFSVNKSLQYWYVALTRSRFILIIIEILICAIHPFPRGFLNNYESVSNLNNITATLSPSGTIPLSFIPIDVALGLPMFARLYLLCRTITFHSHFLRDSSSRSIGYLNKVPINFAFIMKAYIEQSPTFSLGTFCLLIVTMGSWSFRACNYTSSYRHLPMMNSVWLFFTLFTTVGYGDLIPTTYCGRGVATLTALTGVTVSAFLIAVLSQKLLLSRWEKYIYNFVLNIELAKSHKALAVNIIHHGWKMWRLKNLGRIRSIEYLRLEKQFFASISAVHEIKRTRLQMTDNTVGLPEMMVIQRDTNDRSIEVEAKMASIESRMSHVENMLQNIQNSLQTLVSQKST